MQQSVTLHPGKIGLYPCQQYARLGKHTGGGRKILSHIRRPLALRQHESASM
jgi:hypothetical protein